MIDPTRIHGDELDRADALLDALGRGEPPDRDDAVALMLAAWRADVVGDAAPTAAAATGPVTAATGTPAAAANGTPAAAGSGTPTTPAPPRPRAPGSIPEAAPSGRRRPRRWRLAMAASAAVVVAAGGTAAAAATATPSSPFWPIARFIFQERTDRIAAEDALDRARQAATDGRADDARALLDQAERLIGEVDDVETRDRLLRELAELRLLVASTIGPAIPPPPGASDQPSPLPSGSGQQSGEPGDPTGDPLLPSPLLPSPLLPSPLLPSPLLPTTLLPGLPGL